MLVGANLCVRPINQGRHIGLPLQIKNILTKEKTMTIKDALANSPSSDWIFLSTELTWSSPFIFVSSSSFFKRISRLNTFLWFSFTIRKKTGLNDVRAFETWFFMCTSRLFVIGTRRIATGESWIICIVLALPWFVNEWNPKTSYVFSWVTHLTAHAKRSAGSHNSGSLSAQTCGTVRNISG